MSEFVIKLEDVSKMYKLYKSKLIKVLDLIGFPISRGYEEFWALRDINLAIRRGEKVGFIGRNGAGKTTLLKLIAGNLKPTSGKVYVKGEVKALFALGTGFHPELTGRENVLSALAYQGITGKQARVLLDKIIEFTELEEFIDQPIRTYSAGMYARLAFAVATAVKPDILIIDEVLGVGDAYFYAKALERMNELVSGGTTVLFVSHDLPSIQKLCERVIWLKNGRIAMEGEPLDVIKAYLYEVRREEELRLMAKNAGISKRALQNDYCNIQLLIRFIGLNGKMPSEGVPIHKLTLYKGEQVLREIMVGDAMDNNVSSQAYLIVDTGKINWSKPLKVDGKWTRLVKELGGIYRHAVAVFKLPYGIDVSQLDLGVTYMSTGELPLSVEIYTDRGYVTLGRINENPKGEWVEDRFSLSLAYQGTESESSSGVTDNESVDKATHLTSEPEKRELDVYGSGEIKIVAFEILDSSLKARNVFTIGEHLIFRITFERVSDEDIIDPVAVVAIYDLEGRCVAQFISAERGVRLGKLPERGSIYIHLPYLRLGAGEYVISVALFKELNLFDPKEPPAYCLHDRKYRMKIVQPVGINLNLGLVYHECRFQLSWNSKERLRL